jgi:predicted nucleotidyltransferase
MTFEQRFMATVLIGVTAVGLILARRYKNGDVDVGGTIAGFALFLLFLMWLD